MKITYHKNPLYTTVELTTEETEIFNLKIKIAEMEDLLFNAHYRLTEGERFDLKKARKSVEPTYYLGDDPNGLDQHVDKLLNLYVSDLKSYHAGDCTCVPMSCSKCLAEELLGIETTKGLGKHMANKVKAAFGENNEQSKEEALEYLRTYNPTCMHESWKGKEDQFKFHLPRWQAEAKAAYEWLLQYYADHPEII
jgi:hypothetical protein